MRVKFIKNYKAYKIGDEEELKDGDRELKFLLETKTAIESKIIKTKKELNFESFEIKNTELKNKIKELENKIQELEKINKENENKLKKVVEK
ncbi:MAG: hypothetical protein ACRC6K_08855 [Fusobacteriaceae bacterium]